jgi:hypothetical protein
MVVVKFCTPGVPYKTPSHTDSPVMIQNYPHADAGQKNAFMTKLGVPIIDCMGISFDKFYLGLNLPTLAGSIPFVMQKFLNPLFFNNSRTNIRYFKIVYIDKNISFNMIIAIGSTHIFSFLLKI